MSIVKCLSKDVWERHLGGYLSASDYVALWETMNHGMHQLLATLALDYLNVTNLKRDRHRVVNALRLRTQRKVIVDGNSGELIYAFPSGATNVTAICTNIETPLTFEHWPNLQSLCLANVRPVTNATTKMSVLSVVSSLPTSVTSLTLGDSMIGSFGTHAEPIDAFVLTSTICEHLPSLVQLCLPNCAVLIPRDDTRTCQWPLNLTDLTICLQPTLYDQAAKLNWPITLTALSVHRSLPFGTIGSAAFVPVSSLPASLLLFESSIFPVAYDAPLPRHLRYFLCSVITPRYDEVPFELPQTLEQVKPVPSIEESRNMSTKFRILAWSFGQQVPQLDKEAETIWIGLEDRFGARACPSPTPNTIAYTTLRLATNAFTCPPYWFKWNAIPNGELIGVLVPLMSKRLRFASEITCPTIVRLIVAHAKWLTHLSMETASASRALVECIINAGTSSLTGSGIDKIPHLLQSVSLCVRSEEEDEYAYFASVAANHAVVAIESVRKLVLRLDLVRLSSNELFTSLATLFPNLTELHIRFDVATVEHTSPRYLHSDRLQPLLHAFQRLESLRVVPTHPKHMICIEQTPDAYLATIPARVRCVFIDTGVNLRITRT